MPVYNAERFLEESLVSLLAQSYTDFEIVICDNASTDGTPAIIERFAREDSRIRPYRNRKNRGLVANFTRVFELSRGRYFRWNAYDDFCRPALFEECVRALEANPGAIGSFSLAHQIDGEGNVVNTQVETALRVALCSQYPVHRMKATITRNGWSGVIHGLIRRDRLAEFMPYRDYFGADRLLITQLALRGPMIPVADGLFVQRYHDANSSRRSTRELAELLSGRPPRGLIFPMGKAFVDYLRLFRDPSLDPIERLRLTRYLLFHGLRPDVLWNLVVPGPNNYFGLDPGRIRADQSSSARDEASASEPRKIESVGV
jgi:glycosyltransferase involved in cell wall biosynthesis